MARPRGRRLAVAAAGLVVLLLGACATVPDSGSVQQGTGAEAAVAGQDYLLQPITVKPQPGWQPADIVSAFLDATASFAGDYAAARQFLAPGVKWHPDGFAAAVIGPHPTVSLYSCGCRPQPPAQDMASVVVKGDQLATVTSGGQYQASPEGTSYNWRFQLRKIHGQWRITGKLPSVPPLYEPDFQRAYLPRELYFVSADGSSLVPDPVFVPLQATAVDVVRQLVTSLQIAPPWLSGSTTSALSGIPPPTSVTMANGVATVRLTMPPVLFSRLNVGELQAQLAWTLASPSFAQSAIVQSVQLEINGYREQPVTWSGGHLEQNGTPLLSVPQIPLGQPLYSVAGHDVLQRLTPGSSKSTRIPVRTGDDQSPLGAIAVSPGGRYVAWAANRAVYYGPLKSGARLTGWRPGADVTSVSWAPNGSLWVVAGGDVWMLQPYKPPSLLGGEPPGKVISMQIAPDGVRAIMIVKHHGADQLMLGAIQSSGNAVSIGPPLSLGTDVPDPTKAAWYDENDLIVLSQPAGGPLLQEVPVNGRNATALVTPQDIQSISSAGPANPLAAGLTGGRLTLATNVNSTWTAPKGVGQYPAYASG